MAEVDEKIGQAVKAIHDKEGGYLTFTLAAEEYGIGILKIKEIIDELSLLSEAA